jgi:hypothetical protein
VATADEIEQLREKLGVARGTLIVGWLGIAFDYFRDVLHVNPLDPQHVKYLRGIDFHRPVRTTSLEPGSWLVRFPAIVKGEVGPENPKPYRFFSIRGATPLHLGWNPDEVGFQLYQLRSRAHALLSSASAIRFGDDPQSRLRARRSSPSPGRGPLGDWRSRLGGDLQVVLPADADVLLVHERTYDRQKWAELRKAGYLPLGLE